MVFFFHNVCNPLSLSIHCLPVLAVYMGVGHDRSSSVWVFLSRDVTTRDEIRGGGASYKHYTCALSTPKVYSPGAFFPSFYLNTPVHKTWFDYNAWSHVKLLHSCHVVRATSFLTQGKILNCARPRFC